MDSNPITPDWLQPYLTDEINIAGKDNAANLADITADAFRHDPFNNWMFANFDSMQVTFQALAKAIYGPRGVCHRIGNAAAAMWLMPGGSDDLPARDTAALMLGILRRGGPSAVKRILDVDNGMKDKHPKAPHAYLFTVGARQSRQGQGLGGRILRPVLEACDAKSLPAYLENSNPDNHGFYTSLGFKQMEIFSPVQGSPPLEAMWRDPV